jgi:hypothetical protein
MSRSCDAAAAKWKSYRAKALGCRPNAITGLPTLTKIVRAYVRGYRQLAQSEIDFYAVLPSLGEAVRRAARAERPDGKRHGHQTRIRRSAIREAERRLARLDLRKLQDFHELHSLIAEAIGHVSGIGELMVYDTSVRIGAKLGLEPEAVYLHAGTRVGAKAIGLGASVAYLNVSDLPAPFRVLRPREIEDVL